VCWTNGHLTSGSFTPDPSWTLINTVTNTTGVAHHGILQYLVRQNSGSGSFSGTITVGAGYSNCDIAVMAFGLGGLSGVLDQATTSQGVGTGASTGTTGTTGQACEIAAGVIYSSGVTLDGTLSGGYTLVGGVVSGAEQAYKILTATGTAGFTDTAVASANWCGVIATIK
jgi:hypothetical protein